MLSLQMTTSPTDATWEELFDSGQMDQQLAQLNFGQTQQPIQINQHGPHQGLIMRPLLQEQPRPQPLILPSGNNVVRTQASHSMAFLGSAPSPVLPPNPGGFMNGPPTPVNMVRSNGYSLTNQDIPPPLGKVHSTNYTPGLHSCASNRAPTMRNGNNIQTTHDQQPLPLMSLMAHPPGGYQQPNQIQSSHQNIGSQLQAPLHFSRQGQPAPQPSMQKSISSRPPFQQPPPRICPPEGHYTQIPFHHVPPSAVVLSQRPSEPGAIGAIHLDMSVPPPRVPMNGTGPARAPNAYYHNGVGPPAPPNRHQVQKSTKNRNSKSYNQNSLNAHAQQKTSQQMQPVFPMNNNQEEITNANAAAAAYNSVKVESDYPRTLYHPPEPKVTLLKRPVSIPSNLSSQVSSSASGASDNNDIEEATANFVKRTTKSLKQREEEYAQARLRILGSREPETSSAATNVSSIDPRIASTSQSTPDVNLDQQKSLAKNKSTGISLTALPDSTCQSTKSNYTNNSSSQGGMRLLEGPDGKREFDNKSEKNS